MESTCEEDGYKEYTCTICESSYTETLDAHGHEFETETVVDPTCTEEGYTVYYCIWCDAIVESDYVNATGHAFDEWEVTQEPTEYEEGEQERLCMTCGYTETKTVKKLPATRLTLSETNVTLTYKSGIYLLTASEDVTWTSSNEKVVIVNESTGELLPMGKGTAKITAHSVQGEKTAECIVTVKYTWWQMLIRVLLLGFLWY